MSDLLEPRLDVERGPVLWGALVTAACGSVVLLGFQRPGWLLPASILGGVAAGLRGSYYSQSAMEGFVGVAVGLLVLSPVLVGFRALWLGAFPRAGDGPVEFVFLGIVGATADVAIFGPLFLLAGLLGGAVVGKLQLSPDHTVRSVERDP